MASCRKTWPTLELRGVIKRTARLLLLAYCISLGMHLPALQAAAWAGMFLRGSHSLPLKAAIHNTFDGKHLCNLCRNIRLMVRDDRGSLNKSMTKSQKSESTAAKISSPTISIQFSSSSTLLFSPIIARNKTAPRVPPPKNLS